MQVAAELAHLVDPDLVAVRLEDIQVRMCPARDPAGVAEQFPREGDGGYSLTHSRRAVEEVRVRGAVRERGSQQPLRLGLLDQGLEAHKSATRSRTAAAISSGGSAPSSSSTRSGKRSASSA